MIWLQCLIQLSWRTSCIRQVTSRWLTLPLSSRYLSQTAGPITFINLACFCVFYHLVYDRQVTNSFVCRLHLFVSFSFRCHKLNVMFAGQSARQIAVRHSSDLGNEFHAKYGTTLMISGGLFCTAVWGYVSIALWRITWYTVLFLISGVNAVTNELVLKWF